MPTPLGHALGGLIAGWLVAGAGDGAPGSSSADDPAGRGGADRVGQSAAGGAGRRAAPLVGQSSSFARRAVAFAALGMAPDLDLLIGRHSQFTHSIGLAVSVGLVAYALLRLRGARLAGVLSVAAAAAYGSHIALDWLGQDATPPLGIMALWPFSAEYYQSTFGLFWGISRQPWRPGAAWHDFLAIAREILVLGPLVLGAWWLRRPTRQILPSARAADRQPLPPARRAPADGESL